MLIGVKLPGGNINPLSVTASCGLGDIEDREAKDSRQGGERGASSCRERVISEGLTKNSKRLHSSARAITVVSQLTEA